MKKLICSPPTHQNPLVTPNARAQAQVFDELARLEIEIQASRANVDNGDYLSLKWLFEDAVERSLGPGGLTPEAHRLLESRVVQLQEADEERRERSPRLEVHACACAAARHAVGMNCAITLTEAIGRVLTPCAPAGDPSCRVGGQRLGHWLRLAAGASRPDLVRMLLHAGAPATERDDVGFCAIDYARFADCDHTVAILQVESSSGATR